MPDLTPSERTLRARAAAHTMWANTPDPAARLANARAASPSSIEYWERRIDPDSTMPPGERARRAEHARKAHFTRLSLKSAKARRKARELTETAETAERELAELGGDAA